MNAPNQPSGNLPGDGLAKLAAFIAEQERKPIVVPIEVGDQKAASLLVPAGYQLHGLKPLLDAFRLQPELRAGTTQLHDLASFIAWTNRFRDADSVIYAVDQVDRLSLTAVIDHDREGEEEANAKARFGRHRGVYEFPLSREWKEWQGACGQPLGTADFAEFFERRIADVMPPPYGIDGLGEQVFNSQDPEIRKLVETLGKRFATPAEIVKLTRGIEINVDARAVSKIDRDTGEHQIEFAEENGTGTDRVKPPNAFLIAIPVLHNGVPVLMAVHLRYRVGNGKVSWILELHQPERVIEEVFAQALRQVEEETALKPLRGVAPAPRKTGQD